MLLRNSEKVYRTVDIVGARLVYASTGLVPPYRGPGLVAGDMLPARVQVSPEATAVDKVHTKNA